MWRWSSWKRFGITEGEIHPRTAVSMTIVVSVKVTDGIVLAADSTATFLDNSRQPPVKIRNNAHKIFNLVEVSPIGAMAYGTGGIGSASVATLTEDLRQRLASDPTYVLGGGAYTVEEVTKKARAFLFDDVYLKTYPTPIPTFMMGYRVCGYSADASLPEIWEFVIHGATCIGPYEIQSPAEFGIRWAGENEALDRLLRGATGGIKEMLVARGYTENEVQDIYLEMIAKFRTGFELPAMPIQDAIDVSGFLVELSTKFAQFGPGPAMIKGFTEIAAITKNEGFQWVVRKHSYSDELNSCASDDSGLYSDNLSRDLADRESP
jgi:hypothetical protein